ncbi:class I SAM-dependent methyltransferase [Methylobacillus flagellatus]|uniref:class I SAM-dependent methyltransferase n=1 Tax=Methylobacillus flagellatus TaxID=405 RepID=UPI0010F6DF5E|nr:class I SAM-dependent methyltransferase [Methylobacillus flagellatus]
MQRERRSVRPAVSALLISLAALAAMLLLFGVPDQHPVLFLAAQGAIALTLACLLGLAWWWRGMLLLFPLVVYTVQQLALPSAFYLVLFLLFLTLYWSTYRTQVPFYPSRLPVWRQVTQLLPAEGEVHMIDIGSGLGDLAMHVAAQRPCARVTGIEIAPLPWLLSWLRARWRRSAAAFTRGDYQVLDFARYDLVFAYLSPAVMPALWQKASREMRAGSQLVSYEFDIPGAPAPSCAVRPLPDKPALYIWRF